MALAALLVGASGCALSLDTRTLGVPVTFSAPADTTGAQRFSVTSRAIYGLWGAVTLRQPSLQRVLATQLGGGRSVAGLRVKVRSKWTDVLVTVLTAGLIAPRAVTFEGVVTGAPATAP
jgi:hypothetical protein